MTKRRLDYNEDIANNILRTKFEKFVEFDTIRVPTGYDQKVYLRNFYMEYRKYFKVFIPEINDLNFVNASRKLMTGEEFVPTGYKCLRPCSTAQENIDFSTLIKGGTLLGIYGLALLWEQSLDKFVSGHEFVSFDKRYALPHYSLPGGGKDNYVPKIMVDTDGMSKFMLGSYNSLWNPRHILVVFEQVKKT